MTFANWSLCLSALVLAFLASGCASPNVDPQIAAVNSGYVDFYSAAGGNLAWEVQRCDGTEQQCKIVYSDLNPPEQGIVRLRFAPGHYRLRVTILNRVIAQPAVLDVDIANGAVIPVAVTLTETGITSVQTQQTDRGPTTSGHRGRRTQHSSYESSMYRLTAVPQMPQSYQMKQQMSYAQPPAK